MHDMTPAKRPRFEDDAADLPLDLSMEKVERIVRESECVESSKVSSDKTDNDKATTSLVVPVPVSGTSLPLLSSFRHLGLFGLRLPEVTDPFHCNIPESLLAIECKLTENIHEIEFGPPIEYMYNPIKYAFEVHSEYVHKYCRTSKKLLFLGMNAGPWGMSQTGVPFGEINAVTKWLQLSGFIGKPVREHPARKVTGFACKRSEVSGRRFWNLIENVCGTPDKFFRHSFLHNYCPIALMDAAGRNITPADLKGEKQRDLQKLCDEALVEVVNLLRIEKIVSVGRFTEKRARAVITGAGLSTDVLYIPHPSPRSPSNVNWVEKTTEKLAELDLVRFLSDKLNLSDN